MNLKSREYLLLFLRIWVGFIFAYAGFSKLMEPVENFRGMLAEYQVFPYEWLPLIAATVPWVEFIFGIFMILGFALPVTSLVLAAMCLSFLIVLGSSNILLESATKNCGCFGQTGPIQLAVWQIFFLDIINFAIAGKLFASKKTIWSMDGLLGNHRDNSPR